MAERINFDSSALSTGLSVADIFADLEIKFIANRKNLFNTALKTNDFRNECIRQFRAYNEANNAAAAKALNDVATLTGFEIGKSFNVGVSTVDKAVTGFKQQGFKPQKEPISNTAATLAKIAFITSVMNTFTSVANYAKQAADNQLKQIVFQVDDKADNLKEQIDNAQNILLFKGIAGAPQANGKEMSMTSESEFIMRNQTQQALLTAQGQRRAEYGLKYVRISAHPSCCDKCIQWQGKLLIDDRYGGGISDGKTPLLSTAIGDGKNGIYHFNCRHTQTTEIPGFDNPQRYDYDKASVKETADRYAVEQQQRYNERQIRAYKARAAGLMDDNKKALAEQKISEWQARQRALREIAKDKGVPFYRQYAREQIGGKTKPNLPQYRIIYDY